ncbi:MAG: hypothetical protein LBI37_02915 [Puniceicoccales bacterium]|jgi:hypothetical protein|nr:hypothetical protein [Puniceicoccales bacterium]
MELVVAELFVGLLLILCGGFLMVKPFICEKKCKTFMRSELANWVAFGAGVAWFLWHITILGEADFGQYKWIFFGFFLSVAAIVILMVRDFLCIRGMAILVLLASNELLKAAYMCEQKSRLFMVSFVYLAIATAIYLGIVPYRFRDFIEWLFKRKILPRFFGLLVFLYGIIVSSTVVW